MTNGSVARRRYERSEYARKVALTQRACGRVEAGESLAEVCRDPSMPQRSTLTSWLVANPELKEMMDAAKARAAETFPPRRAYHRWSPAVGDEVLQRVAHGRGVYEVCAEPDMPAASTVMRWLAEQPDYAEAYGRARLAQAERLFDLAWRIACDATEETVATARLKIQTLKWRVTRLAPRKYGRAADLEAVAAARADAAAEAEAARIEARPVFEVRHFAVTPAKKVLDVTGAVRGLPQAEADGIKAQVRSGALSEADVGALNASADAALTAALRACAG